MTLDLTGIVVAITGGVFSIVATVLPLWLVSHLKDKAAAAVLAATIKNSLGALQQAATSAITITRPSIPNVPMSLAPGVQYVLDHAGDEAARFGLDPVAIAQKVEAQIGLKNIETNIAVASSATPTVVAPLAAVPVVGPLPLGTVR
jgi:hypothetical protein